ncbi:hypothetical protein MMC24_005438 [Lignoscripta atroalba]|nr:hypothetical protein [Lignoscripta atroalba]
MPPPSPSISPTCPFCAIATSTPPCASSPFNPPRCPPSPSTTATAQQPPTAHLLLSTPHLLAFLDHAPISRGHVLLATRQHREKLSDVSVEEGRALGAWMGVVSRAVVGVALEGKDKSGWGGEQGDGPDEVGDWNVVQNNGARAAQVVPHVHFHIIPRPGDVPEIKNRSWTIFGKGQREELDEEDAEVLLEKMRARLQREVQRVGEREGEEAVRVLMGGGWEEGEGDGNGDERQRKRERERESKL